MSRQGFSWEAAAVVWPVRKTRELASPRTDVKCAGILFGVMATLMMAACGGGQAPSVGDPSASIEIYSQMDPAPGQLLDRQVTDFERLHKTIKVTVVRYDAAELQNRFQNAVSAGVGPEIVYAPAANLVPWSRMKLIQPIDTLMGSTFVEQFATSAVGSMSYLGHVYAAPDMYGGHLMLLYNRKLATDSAMSQATGFIWPPNNTDDLVKAAQHFTDQSKKHYGLVFSEMDPLWLAPWIGGFGGALLDTKNRPTLDSRAVVDALTYERQLAITSGLSPAVDQSTAESLFKTGRAAFIIDGDWSLADYGRSLGSYLGIAPLPLVTKTARWATPYTVASGYSLSTHARGDKLRAAILFLRFITAARQDVNVAMFGEIPANKAAAADPLVTDNPVLSLSSIAIKHGVPMPNAPQIAAVWDAIKGPLADVMDGKAGPAAAAAAMQAGAEQRISS